MPDSTRELTATARHELLCDLRSKTVLQAVEKVVLDSLVEVVDVSKREDRPVCEEGLEHIVSLLLDPVIVFVVTYDVAVNLIFSPLNHHMLKKELDLFVSILVWLST